MWNKMRTEEPNLSEADLRNVDLRGYRLAGVNFWGADLSRANLAGAYLENCNFVRSKLRGTNLKRVRAVEVDFLGADLSRANLSTGVFHGARMETAVLRGTVAVGADFAGASLAGSDLSRSCFVFAHMPGANLAHCDLTNADFRRTDLTEAQLIGANVEGVDLSGSSVYGINVWSVQGVPSDSTELSISVPFRGISTARIVDGRVMRPTFNAVTVDNLQLAQFVHYLLSTTELGSLIDLLNSRVVLILGRFTGDRLSVLHDIRTCLRSLGYAAIVFDFARPVDLGFGETIMALAAISAFVVCDVTDAVEARTELANILKELPSVPVKPILRSGEPLYSTFSDHAARSSLALPVLEYADSHDLRGRLVDEVILPCRRLRGELSRAQQSLGLPMAPAAMTGSPPHRDDIYALRYRYASRGDDWWIQSLKRSLPRHKRRMPDNDRLHLSAGPGITMWNRGTNPVTDIRIWHDGHEVAHVDELLPNERHAVDRWMSQESGALAIFDVLWRRDPHVGYFGASVCYERGFGSLPL
ncbi:MAG: pentapeptide repeat-containing protein [Actinomycetia bacterium]|nr:pentapeptide repeat-containing protein [Actinomycetes bacterium]